MISLWDLVSGTPIRDTTFPASRVFATASSFCSSVRPFDASSDALHLSQNSTRFVISSIARMRRASPFRSLAQAIAAATRAPKNGNKPPATTFRTSVAERPERKLLTVAVYRPWHRMFPGSCDCRVAHSSPLFVKFREIDFALTLPHQRTRRSKSNRYANPRVSGTAHKWPDSVTGVS